MTGEQPYQAPAQAGQGFTKPAQLNSVRPGSAVAVRKLIIGVVVLGLVIAAAVIGHALVSANSIAVGDCVVTNPNPITGWDIKKVGCGSNPGTAFTVQRVVSVQNGSNGQCDLGLTTFQDQPAGKTYCLNGSAFDNGG